MQPKEKEKKRKKKKKKVFQCLVTPSESTHLFSSIQCPSTALDSPLRDRAALMNAAGWAVRRKMATRRGTANPALLTEVAVFRKKGTIVVVFSIL